MRASILLLLILISCTEEKLPTRDFPFLITGAVEVSESGAVLNAEVVNAGSVPVTRFGFLFGDEFELANAAEVSGEFREGKYSLTLNAALQENFVYHAKAFAQTPDKLVVGEVVTFTSQGSLPPALVSFSPVEGPIDRPVELVVENLGIPHALGSKVVVLFGEVIAPIDSIESGKIYVRVPTITKGQKVPITISIAGMTDTSTDLFDMWFPWSRIIDFPGTVLNGVNSFAVDGKLYVLGGHNYFNQSSKAIWMYDPAINVWQLKTPFPGIARHSAISFSVNGKGYYGLGQFMLDLWEYDPISNAWTQKAPFAGTPAESQASFSIGDKGYVALGRSNSGTLLRELWQYDPSSNQWVRKKDFPSVGRYPGISAGNTSKGYLGMGFNGSLTPDFFEYDPTADEWVMMGDFPGSGRELTGSGVIDNQIYAGLGMNANSSPVEEFWRFDIPSKTWSTTNPCPTAMAPYVMQTIGTKLYVGHSYIELLGDPALGKIFYTFDPTKQ